MNVVDVCKEIFLKNPFDKQLIISFEDVNNTRELFFTLLDIFIKGIIMTCSDTNEFNINNITTEQLFNVTIKMKNISIDTIINEFTLEDGIKNKIILSENPSNELQRSIYICNVKNDNDALRNFKINVIIKDVLYVIHFDIMAVY